MPRVRAPGSPELCEVSRLHRALLSPVVSNLLEGVELISAGVSACNQRAGRHHHRGEEGTEAEVPTNKILELDLVAEVLDDPPLGDRADGKRAGQK